MGDLSIWWRIKEWIGSLAWRVFLWANETTEEKYLAGDYQRLLRE